MSYKREAIATWDVLDPTDNDREPDGREKSASTD